MMNYFYKFAAVDEYNCDAYGAGAYGECETQAVAQPGQPSDGGSGPLANTGYDVIMPVALGIAIIGASVVWLFKKKRQPGKTNS